MKMAFEVAEAKLTVEAVVSIGQLAVMMPVLKVQSNSTHDREKRIKGVRSSKDTENKT